uniref:Uncharacterized protein n=1 Tax=Branchiostoma floridae TaxID=7739 RepID=C3ZPS0_BRAFL|eukprot:XP_002589288.1 hypothetical protein BRAFLDRAFT_97391 [Branchiostoma floridae]
MASMKALSCVYTISTAHKGLPWLCLPGPRVCNLALKPLGLVAASIQLRGQRTHSGGHATKDGTSHRGEREGPQGETPQNNGRDDTFACSTPLRAEWTRPIKADKDVYWAGPTRLDRGGSPTQRTHRETSP